MLQLRRDLPSLVFGQYPQYPLPGCSISGFSPAIHDVNEIHQFRSPKKRGKTRETFALTLPILDLDVDSACLRCTGYHDVTQRLQNLHVGKRVILLPTTGRCVAVLGVWFKYRCIPDAVARGKMCRNNIVESPTAYVGA